MLGEEHSLKHEFPEHAEKIDTLAKDDQAFKQDMDQYNMLDNEIRELEINSAPIDDTQMHQKKHLRATLKDSLYHRLIAN